MSRGEIGEGPLVLMGCILYIHLIPHSEQLVISFSTYIIAECLSMRLLILQCMFLVGGVWCHAQECNLSHLVKVWLVHKHPSRLRMPSCLQKVVYTYKFIVLSAVAALAVSLSCQNGKSCDGSKEERTRSLARKQMRQSINAASMTWSLLWERWVREREQQHLAKQIKRVVVLINDHIRQFEMCSQTLSM